MLYELCTFTGMVVLGAFVFILLMQIYIVISNKIKEKRQIIILEQYDNITYNGIEYKIMSRKVKVKKLNERKHIGEKTDKYNDYY